MLEFLLQESKMVHFSLPQPFKELFVEEKEGTRQLLGKSITFICTENYRKLELEHEITFGDRFSQSLSTLHSQWQRLFAVHFFIKRRRWQADCDNVEAPHAFKTVCSKQSQRCRVLPRFCANSCLMKT